MEIYINFTDEEAANIFEAHKFWEGKGSKSVNKFIKFAALEMAKKIQIREFDKIKKDLKE